MSNPSPPDPQISQKVDSVGELPEKMTRSESELITNGVAEGEIPVAVPIIDVARRRITWLQDRVGWWRDRTPRSIAQSD